jgi:hypothetical protein
MKTRIVFLLVMMVVGSCTNEPEKKSELEVAIEGIAHQIDLSKLSFFPKELIHLCKEATFRNKFIENLNLHNGIEHKTVQDQKEYDLILHLLYLRVEAEKDYALRYQDGKDFLLQLLGKWKKINFSVDKNLILQQIDDKKRGMLNGYDEGTTAESNFVFFCYNPILYKTALLENDLKDDWQSTGVFLCNYLRENNNPTAIRYSIKQKLLSMLSKEEGNDEFKEVIRELSDCDVSKDLFD